MTRPAAPIPYCRLRPDKRRSGPTWRYTMVGPSWSTVPRQRPIPGGNLYGYIHRTPNDGPLAGWLVFAADGTKPYGDTLWPTLDRAAECLAET